MKVYYVYPDKYDYDQFDGLVVVAENKENVLSMIENGGCSGYYFNDGYFKKNQGKIHIEEVDLTFEHVVLESFNAG